MRFTRRTVLCIPPALWLAGCALQPREQFSSALRDDPDIAGIEKETGGRIGVALIQSDGRVVLRHRADVRFAMCSTFKAPLASALFAAHDAGRVDRFAPVSVREDDLVPYAPFAEKRAQDGRATSLTELAQYAVLVSDNAAANIVLRAIGGPEAFTRFVRSKGDTVTRLDRNEPALNENAVGDLRDTTSPLAMAQLMRELLLSPGRNTAHARLLTDWMRDVTTGFKRIRAGLPAGWKVGDKTGTAPPPAAAYNDIAIIDPPDHSPCILTVYLDRPDVSAEQADIAIARIAAIAAGAMSKSGRRGT